MSRTELLNHIRCALIDSDDYDILMNKMYAAETNELAAVANKLEICSCRMVQFIDSGTKVKKEATCLNPRLPKLAVCSRKQFASCPHKMSFSFRRYIPPRGQLIRINLGD